MLREGKYIAPRIEGISLVPKKEDSVLVGQNSDNQIPSYNDMNYGGGSASNMPVRLKGKLSDSPREDSQPSDQDALPGAERIRTLQKNAQQKGWGY